jgi:hypothetical protein
MAAADVKPIDELFAGKILTRTNVILGNLLCLPPVLLLLAGVGLAAGAAYLAFGEEAAPGGGPPLDPGVGGLLIAAGVLAVAVSAYWGLRHPTGLADRYLRTLARREILSRPDGIVDPDDPEAIFVELVPRQNWKRLMLETATDVGFLVVDETRQEVLFEGDRERMRIPAAAILSCEVEQIVIGEWASAGIPFYLIVIRAQHPSGARELPFAYRGDVGQLGVEVRERRASALRDRIGALIPSREPTSPDVRISRAGDEIKEWG